MYLNQERFNKTYLENFNKILNFLKSKCNNNSEAEDLTQESFTKLWLNRDKVEMGKETSFLYTIAYNLFIDTKRKDQVRFKYQKHIKPDITNETPEFQYLKKEFQDYVNVKIQSIPESSRNVFIMNKIDKLTYSEISSIIGLSIKSVEKRMCLALKTYREIKKFQ
ncbi:MAG: hypothetical protein RLZZ546_3380 [Bacteroidota bacterium]|jgi:RNA polymerase sigma-70 factor (ECF subfamily)